MRKRLVRFSILCGILLLGGGCSAPDQYPWIPWYSFRGHCYLKMNITVSSLPGEAQVFVNGTFKGTTPHTFDYEATSYISGQKRKLPAPQDGAVAFETRGTTFLQDTAIEILVVKRGYKPLKKTIIMEEYFFSDRLDHDKRYGTSLRLVYSLKELGWSSPGKGKVRVETGKPESTP